MQPATLSLTAGNVEARTLAAHLLQVLRSLAQGVDLRVVCALQLLWVIVRHVLRLHVAKQGAASTVPARRRKNKLSTTRRRQQG
jgi:hypothetical protein